MGNGNVLGALMLNPDAFLLTPHGEREPKVIRAPVVAGFAPNPSWGTGTK